MLRKFFSLFKDKKAKTKKIDNTQLNFINGCNKINQTADRLLMCKEPTIFSLEQESNILCKYKKNYILTKDGNLSMGVELKGASYSALSPDDELSYLESRIAFFTKLHPQIEMNIIVKKEKVFHKSHMPLRSKNIYAKD